MSIFTCTIPGTPQQQGSKRNVGKVSIEANKNLAPWRADAIYALRWAMEKQQVEQFTGAVVVFATFTYKRPSSHYGSGKNASVLKATAPYFKCTAPDLDKLQRALGDALTQSAVIRDDCLIVKWSPLKVWGEIPGTEVIVENASG